jgi:hypothetical protein
LLLLRSLANCGWKVTWSGHAQREVTNPSALTIARKIINCISVFAKPSARVHKESQAIPAVFLSSLSTPESPFTKILHTHQQTPASFPIDPRSLRQARGSLRTSTCRYSLVVVSSRIDSRFILHARVCTDQPLLIYLSDIQLLGNGRQGH